MRPASLAVLFGALVSLAVRAQSERVPQVQHVVGRPMDISLPFHFCTVPEAVASFARRGYIIAGIEYLPGDCNAVRFSTPRSKETVSLAGLTVAEALAKLIDIDSRYHWVDSNGVILLRPVAHSGDSQNWLHSIAPSFDIEGQTIAVALLQVASGVTGQKRAWGQSAHLTPLGERPLSVHLKRVSTLETLNAIVRAHRGSLVGSPRSSASRGGSRRSDDVGQHSR